MARGQHVDTSDLDLGPMGTFVTDETIQESQFFAEYLHRLVSGRDMHVIVTAASETGVGKTTLAVTLALLLDQHGWTADKAAVADPAEYSSKYDEVKPGSVLLLDEAEKAADARRGMTTESVTISQDFATKRYQQVFGILTAPSKSWVDKRLGGDAADYWIQAQETDMGRIKGEATVYRLRSNEFHGDTYTTREETITWPKLDWHPEFQALDKRKRELLEGTEDSPYMHEDDVADIKKRIRKEAVRKTELEIIERMAESDIKNKNKASTGFQQKEIAEAFGVSRPRISQRLNND